MSEKLAPAPSTVSVIIPNYNGRSHLPDCIASLLATVPWSVELEIIVVDNGSTDDSIGWLNATHPKVRVIANGRNLGFARAVNRGAQEGHGEYVAFLNTDMRVDADWLAALLDTLRKARDMKCVGSIVLDWTGEKVDFAGRPDDALNLLMRPPAESSMLAKVSEDSSLLFASGGAMLMRRASFLELGGFDEDYFLYNEDVDFGWRFWLRGGRVVRSARSRVYHRGGASAQEFGLESVMRLAQSSTLCTLIKNLGEEELRRVLPLVLYYLVDRGSWFKEAGLSLGGAVKAVLDGLPVLLEKRRVVQQTRVRTDASLFSEVGHPLAGVLDEARVRSFAENRRARTLLTAKLTLTPAPFARYLREALRCASEYSRRETKGNQSKQASPASCPQRDQGTPFWKAGPRRVRGLARQKNEARGGMRSSLSQSQSAAMRALRRWLPTRVKSWIKRALLRSSSRWAGTGSFASSGSGAARVDEQSDCKLVYGKYDVVVFSIIDWHVRHQRPQQMAIQFARHGHRVFYLSTGQPGSVQPKPGSIVVEPLHERILGVTLGASRPMNIYRDSVSGPVGSELATALAELSRKYGIHEAVALVQLPFWAPVALGAHDRFGWRVVYDCMDRHSGFSTNSAAVLRREEELRERSDLVVASSLELMEDQRGHSAPSVLIRNACDFRHFARSPRGAVSGLPHSKRPTIGYFGAISDWFDAKLVAEIASRRPEWEFVLIGSTSGCRLGLLPRLKNVRLLGEQLYKELPGYLHQFDVCIIPFLITTLTRATNPVKVYEYLSAGKPVVSTDLPELASLRDRGLVRTAHDADDWVNKIEAALMDNGDQAVRARRLFACQNTWSKRFVALHGAIRNIYPRVSIIIATHNRRELTGACFESLFRNTCWPNFEVIVVDNASTDGTVDYLRDMVARQSNVRLIVNDSNAGFAPANNQGICHASGDFVVFLNNDTRVTRGWLCRLVGLLEKDETIGLVGPVTNSIGNEARIDVSYASPGEMEDFAEARTWDLAGRAFEIPMLALFCAAARRTTLDAVGLLDERYRIGMFEDDDLAHRLRVAGYSVVCAEDAFIHHEQGASFRQYSEAQYTEWFLANRKRFEQKWKVTWLPPGARGQGRR